MNKNALDYFLTMNRVKALIGCDRFVLLMICHFAGPPPYTWPIRLPPPEMKFQHWSGLVSTVHPENPALDICPQCALPGFLLIIASSHTTYTCDASIICALCFRENVRLDCLLP